MSTPFVRSQVVKGRDVEDRSSLDGSVPHSFDFSLCGQWTGSLQTTEQRMLIGDSVEGNIPVNSSVVLSKDSYVDLHDFEFDFNVPSTSSGGCWLHVSIFAYSSQIEYYMFDQYFNIDVGQYLHLDVPDMNNMVVKKGWNVVLLLTPSGTNRVDINIHGHLVVDDS